jgi:SRSO17 transposase
MDFSRGGWWIIDDTGFPKMGGHSVGVARQYCGSLGKQDNCQVAVSVSPACDQGRFPVAWQLYLPEEWAALRAQRQWRTRSGRCVIGWLTNWSPNSGHAQAAAE